MRRRVFFIAILILVLTSLALTAAGGFADGGATVTVRVKVVRSVHVNGSTPARPCAGVRVQVENGLVTFVSP